jgi:hypothetical protein
VVMATSSSKAVGSSARARCKACSSSTPTAGLISAKRAWRDSSCRPVVLLSRGPDLDPLACGRCPPATGAAGGLVIPPGRSRLLRGRRPAPAGKSPR